jgi:hypothetical protein
MKMLVKAINIIILTLLLVTSLGASATMPITELAQVISNLDNVKTPLHTIIEKAKKAFRLNGLADTPGADFEQMTTSKANPYIASLKYNNSNYRVKLTFKASTQANLTGDVNSESTDVTQIVESADTTADKLLSTKTIILVPIFASIDQNINAWECITDVGSNTSEVLDKKLSNTALNTEPSLISELSDSPYLSNCNFYHQASTY